MLSTVLADTLRILEDNGELDLDDLKGLCLISSTYFSLMSPCLYKRAVFSQRLSGAVEYLVYRGHKPTKLKDVQSLNSALLPPSATQLSCSYNFNKPILKPITNALTHITFGGLFNHPLDNLPPTITHLAVGSNFNQSLEDLHDSITHLSVSVSFNKSVDYLPKNLTHLELGINFDQHVDYLPSSLTRLIFGYKFDWPVDNLPPTLTHLSFGYSFNRPVDNLPKSLTHLNFGYSFNNPVDHLPPKLLQVCFGFSFDQPADYLPPNLVCLIFGHSFNHPVDNLPFHLTHLLLGCNILIYHDLLSPSTFYLTWDAGQGQFDQPVDYLPISLTCLAFGDNFNQSIEFIPQKIDKLILGTKFVLPTHDFPYTKIIRLSKKNSSTMMNFSEMIFSTSTIY